MIIYEDQRRMLDLYIKSLETFCTYSINEDVGTFWNIVKKPQLIQKWRERTALKLCNRELCSRYYKPPIDQEPGIILSLSEYFKEPLADDSDIDGCLNEEKDNWNKTILDIDRQICKGLCTELCDPNSLYGSDDFFTEKQRMNAIKELRKPLKKT